MPTTFNVLFLGVLPDLDTVEGNDAIENATALNGMTFGSVENPLYQDFAELSPVGDPGAIYDHANNPDQFSIDGGAAQTYDGSAVYNATITYVDGSMASFTAVVIQDENGNAYIVPEFSDNADQAALEAAAIRTITLNNHIGGTSTGTTVNRQNWYFVTCFTRGTEIETVDGPVAVESLKPGDLIMTVDRGPQPLRWVGSRTVRVAGNMAPILMRKGALGNTKDLTVSPQHRILLSGWRAELYIGESEALAAAKHLVNDDTIRVQVGGDVDYFHIMFDQHELVYAAGIASESFNPGQCAWDVMSQGAREEILTLFPELRNEGIAAYGATVRVTTKAYEARLLLA